jgi:type III secretion protein U
MSGEKTEKPTAKKLRDARERGEIARSPDAISTAAFFSQLLLFWTAGSWIDEHLRRLITGTLELAARPWGPSTLVQAAEFMVWEFLLLSSVPLLLAAVMAAFAGAFLNGWLVSFQAMTPKFEKLNPAQGIQQLFAMRNLINLIKMLLKVALLGLVTFLVLRSALRPVAFASTLELPHILALATDIIATIALWALLIYAVVAVIDNVHERYEHTKQNKMTKDEVKREYKDAEGDPHIKGQRQEIARDIAFNGMVEQVKSASVVVVNPTHVAVAIRYKEGETPLPLVVAKGEDAAALRIREVAEQADVPILRNVTLARRLNELCPLNQYVIEELLEPVAEVLRWVKRLHEQRKSARGD